jgi:membrane-bound lytic murein transglycosylase D
MRPWYVLGGLLLAAPPAGARADHAEASAPQGETAGVEPTDVAEALRLARLDLAALERLEVPSLSGVDDRAPIAVDATPSALSSEIPEATEDPAPEPDVAWLEGVTLPDIPVRWDARLIDLLEYYRDNPRGQNHIRAWVERSGRYAPMIRQKLRDAGLPEDLMYVAMVESGYDPTVRSPAGALGMWQFIASTGQDYGLSVDRWVDERQSPERATDAAIGFFGDLYSQLQSWPLSIAAYNMGYGALLRSIRKYNTNDFWVLSRVEAGLPYETVIYVTKVMACAIVAHNPERFGLGDLELDPPVDAAFVTAPGGTGMGRLARAAGISKDELAALNPEIKRGRLPPDEATWPLRVPTAAVERFERRWPELASRTPSHGTHVLRFGERLRDVAEMYGTSERKLQKLNDLDSSDEARPGTRLRVPDVEPQPPADDGQAEVVVGVPDREFAYHDRKRVFYQVRSGDRLGDVARHFRVTLDELRTWNDVSNDAALHDGMFLQLFVPDDLDLRKALVLPEERVRILVVGSKEFLDYHEAQRDRVRIRYRVGEGDSLRSLSSRFDLSVGSIARINGFSRYRDLEPNDEIILYVPADAARRL